MEAVAREVLPAGFTFAWSGLAYEEKKSGSTSAIAFVFGLIIVFLVLAAQYESWTLPGAVMAAVPFGVLGALTANWLRGLENDVYFQIGLLVLIGLGAKNAVCESPPPSSCASRASRSWTQPSKRVSRDCGPSS